ncbi:MAG: hypothetical protein P1U56_08650 [Saprospiraceae bacterium]|nr:hypothetical protein [Saprospiraceae bacterium]
MKKTILSYVLLVLLASSCQQTKQAIDPEVLLWETGWGMYLNVMDNHTVRAEEQFESLLQHSNEMDELFFKTGILLKMELEKHKEVDQIFADLPEHLLQRYCMNEDLSNLKFCKDIQKPQPSDPKLQLELVKMFINDQYALSNLMLDMLSKYNLKKEDVIIDSFGISTNNDNQARLKEIIKTNGFPTRAQVGKDAMNGVFHIIQHADNDPEWQASQLINMQKAADNLDIPPSSFAYLYDRIQINKDEKQKYGTQFKKVGNSYVLFEVEDSINLDNRRRKMQMMPFQIYKSIHDKMVSKNK